MVFLLYFRNAILAKDCADCKMTVNFHITTVVNEDFFPVFTTAVKTRRYMVSIQEITFMIIILLYMKL